MFNMMTYVWKERTELQRTLSLLRRLLRKG